MRAVIPLLFAAPSVLMAQGERQNILFIIADDLRPALSCYGYPDVQTPNLDKLAANATVFRRAFCNAPVSGASRASLLTGLYPDMPERFSAFDAWASKDAPDAVSLPGWLKEHGYTTLSFGKVFHNLKDHDSDWSEYPWRLYPEGYGKDWADYNKWELWLNDSSAQHVNPKTHRGPFCESADRPDSDYDDGQVALHAKAKLKELSESGKPFFMAVGFWRPHLPFNAPKKYWDLYDRSKIQIADNRFRPENLPRQCSGSGEIKGYGLVDDTTDPEFHALARHAYYACVSFIDAQIGLLLDELESGGLAANTTVVFIGDHGWHLGEHEFWGKHNLLFNAVNAPLIIRQPGGKGRSCDSVVEFVDLFPTFCDYVGIEAPSSVDGTSLRPIISGKKNSVKRYAYIQWGKGRAICDRRYSYAAWFDEKGSVNAQMLFDHKTDPQENINIAGEKKYRHIVRRLSKAMKRFD